MHFHTIRGGRYPSLGVEVLLYLLHLALLLLVSLLLQILDLSVQVDETLVGGD